MTDRDRMRADNPWPKAGWWSAAALVGVSFVLGFIVLARYQVDGPTLDTWTAICRAIGLTADTEPASEPQPPLRTPTYLAWTAATLARVASGSEQRGGFIAMNCAACHGEQGVSPTSLIPSLAGMDGAVIYKQLNDYRSGKRLWGVMSAMAAALTEQDSADVAAWFAHRADGPPPVSGEGVPHNPGQDDPTVRLVFVGDPGRGLPPCAACHGPSARKLGAPALRGQHADYIERQIVAFAQGMRRNDIIALVLVVLPLRGAHSAGRAGPLGVVAVWPAPLTEPPWRRCRRRRASGHPRCQGDSPPGLRCLVRRRLNVGVMTHSRMDKSIPRSARGIYGAVRLVTYQPAKTLPAQIVS
jgi:cytochrome c553